MYQNSRYPFDFNLVLDCLCIVALYVFNKSLTIIVGSFEFSKGPTTLFPVKYIVVIVMLSYGDRTFRSEPRLLN